MSTQTTRSQALNHPLVRWGALFVLAAGLVVALASSGRGTSMPAVAQSQGSSLPTAVSARGTSAAQVPAVAPSQSTPSLQPATAATGTPAFAPAASDYSGVGISLADTLGSLSDAALAAELDDLVALHVKLIRIDIDWSVIERREGHFDWKLLDRTVAAANERGLNILGIIVYTPTWARPSDCNSNRCPPASDEDYAQFAEAVASRYAPEGVHAWEIWNEPNMQGSWEPQADAAEYAHLLSAAYAAIKKVDKDATLVTGGLGPIATGEGNIAPLEYLLQLYAAGGKNYFDAVGFHPYSFPVPPGYVASWNAWQQMAATKPSVRSIMAANGDSAKKIWITEYGAPTDGPGAVADIGAYRLEDHTDHVTESLQAHMITDAVSEVSRDAWAGPLFIYSYKDLGTSDATQENFFGILHFDGSKKPAYTALKAALSL